MENSDGKISAAHLIAISKATTSFFIVIWMLEIEKRTPPYTVPLPYYNKPKAYRQALIVNRKKLNAILSPFILLFQDL